MKFQRISLPISAYTAGLFVLVNAAATPPIFASNPPVTPLLGSVAQLSQSPEQRFDQLRNKKEPMTAADFQEIYSLAQGPLRKDMPRRLIAAQKMGQAAGARSEWDEAIRYFNEVLSIAESQPPDEKPPLMAVGSWYEACLLTINGIIAATQAKGIPLLLSNPSAARAEFEKAAALCQNPKYRDTLGAERGAILMYIALTYQQEFRFREALAYLNQALPDYTDLEPSDQFSYRATAAACHFGLGERRRAAGEAMKAIVVAKNANIGGPILLPVMALLNQLSESGGSRPDEGLPSPGTKGGPAFDPLAGLSAPEYHSVLEVVKGLLQFVGGNNEGAEEIFQTMLKRAETNQWPGLILACRAGLGDIALRRKNLKVAGDHYRRANEGFDRLTTGMGDPTLVGPVQQALANFPAHYADVLVRQGKTLHALAVVDRARGIGLLRLASARDGVYAGRVAPQAVVEARRLQTIFRKEAAAFRAAPKKAENVRKHAASKAAWEKYVGELPTKFPEYGAWLAAQRTTPATLTRLAAQQPTTLFLHVDIVDANLTLVFTLSKITGCRVFPLKMGVPQWKKLVTDWNESLQTERQQELAVRASKQWKDLNEKEPELARILFKALLGPLEQKGLLAGHSRLVIVPDGPLWNVPFAALMNAQGKRLADRFPISVTVSLSQVLDKGKKMVADKKSLPLYYIANPSTLTKNASATVTQSQMASLDDLSLAAATVKRIARTVPGARGVEGPGVREEVIKAMLPQAKLLFFATHGILVSPNPERMDLGESAGSGLESYLLLASEENAGRGDGRLDGQDLLDLPQRLSAQLAVLMACSSGEGVPAGGEGLMGLVWSFWGAGCPSVVASGWKVDQEASSLLMERFWAALKALPKDEALRLAMKQLRESKSRYKSPYYWAAFQVYGDTGRLSLTAN